MADVVWRLELFGALLTFALGSLLHFAFAWSGRWTPLALVAAVNESIWEHLKIGFWPLLLFALVEYPLVAPFTHNFWAAKAAALLLQPLAIVLVFRAYTRLLGRHLLAFDIGLFAFAALIAQVVSYLILTGSPLPPFINSLGLLVVLLLVAAFSLFTFFPPHRPLFRDERTLGYGLEVPGSPPPARPPSSPRTSAKE